MIPRVLVGTVDGIHELGEEREVHLAGHRAGCLAKDASSWWAVIDDTEIWRSTDAGEWRRIASTGPLRANCVLPHADGALVGTADAHLLVLRDGELSQVAAFEDAPGRDGWHTPSGRPPDTRSLAVDPAGTIYANVHVGGVARAASLEGGWEPTIDVDADVHEVVFDRASGSLFAASAIGLASSPDGGGTWEFDSEGLHAAYQRAVAVAGTTVFVSASTGPRAERAAVYRKRFGEGTSFTRCATGLPEWFPSNIETFCLSAVGEWVAIGTSGGAVYLSTDCGTSWNLLVEGLPSVRSVELA